MNISKVFSSFITKCYKNTYTKNGLVRNMKSHNAICMSTKASPYETNKERETFQDALPTIFDTLMVNPQFKEVPDIASWIKKVLDYNVSGGKKNRGLTTVLSYKILEKPENISEESLRLACIMGWCTEILQAYLVILDDVMDGSVTRRGKPCWYQLPDVGLGALNDSVLVYSSLFQTLRAYFGDKPQYKDIVDLFNETLLYTSIGQHLDYSLAHRKKNDYSLFTIEQYNAIVKYKSAYYTFKLPIILGLLLTESNNVSKQTLKNIEDICIKMGTLFQMQDDFIDCFVDESITGKAGTDIQEGKCSWLAATALQRCTDAQRIVFTTCYGSKEPAHVERIKQLYTELQLPQLYSQEESVLYESIINESKLLPLDTAPELFKKVLDLIYKRNQ